MRSSACKCKDALLPCRSNRAPVVTKSVCWPGALQHGQPARTAGALLFILHFHALRVRHVQTSAKFCQQTLLQVPRSVRNARGRKNRSWAPRRLTEHELALSGCSARPAITCCTLDAESLRTPACSCAMHEARSLDCTRKDPWPRQRRFWASRGACCTMSSRRRLHKSSVVATAEPHWPRRSVPTRVRATSSAAGFPDAWARAAGG